MSDGKSFPPGREEPRRILIAEDERKLLRALKRHATSAGFVVLPCASCHACEQVLLRQEPLDAAVLDVFLGDGASFRIMSELRSRYPGIPIIAVSGAAADEHVLLTGRVDVDAFIRKPFTFRRLARTLESLWNGTEPTSEVWIDFDVAPARLKERAIRTAYARFDGNVSAAARSLGISRQRFQYWAGKQGLGREPAGRG